MSSSEHQKNAETLLRIFVDLAVLFLFCCAPSILCIGPPEVQPFAFSKNIALGQKALVNCGTVGGDGPFKFHWVQDGRDLQPTSSKYAKTVSETFATLVIEAVGAEDVGNYTCTVSNAAGEDSFTAPLTVKD